MRILVTLMMMACLAVSAADKKELTPEEKKQQEKLEKEFGAYAKEPKDIKYYKETTYQALKASKKEMENKKVRYEGVYKGFSDNFPQYVEDSGYSGKRYHFIMVNGLDIPVLSKRKKDFIEVLGKLNKGVKVIVYGRLKEFKKDPVRAGLPRYFVDMSHLQILTLEAEGAAGNDNDDVEKWRDGVERRRPIRRRR